MGGPVVALHAVHPAHFGLRDVIGERPFAEHSDDPIRDRKTDPGDLVTPFVAGEILDPITNRHEREPRNEEAWGRQAGQDPDVRIPDMSHRI